MISPGAALPCGMSTGAPRCWKCGYELTGLRVDQNCPECATPVWPLPVKKRPADIADAARNWGVLSIGLILLVGPLAGLAAIPAIIYARRARLVIASGRLPASELKDARTGLICGITGAVLSIALAMVYAVMLSRAL